MKIEILFILILLPIILSINKKINNLNSKRCIQKDTIIKDFKLVRPNVKKTKSKTGDSELLAYLKTHYNLIYIKKQKENNCFIKAKFSNNIIFIGNECGIGISNYKLETHKIRICDAKKIISEIFSNEYYKWSNDSLQHKSLDDAGGDLRYEIVKDRLIIEIEYTD